MNPSTPSKPLVTRRKFLSTAAAAAAAPTIIPASALGKAGRPAPSERINVACFGYGTIAQGVTGNFLNDDRVQVTSVADPVSELPHYGYSGEKTGGRDVGKRVIEAYYAKESGNGTFKGCNTYSDFRELIEKEDVDAVQVSTPDHWHAYMAVYLAKRGKHVYGQKPLALTVDEGRKMEQAVKAAGVTWQTGSQQRSDVYFRQASEFIRNNRLGKLKPVVVGLPSGHKDFSKLGGKQDVSALPDGIDFDLWTGPAPMRDYRPAMLPLNWRWNFDYSGGMITDWGAHHIDIVHWALDKDETGPTSIEILDAEIPPEEAFYNTVTQFSFKCTYADGHEMIVNDNKRSPQGILFEGEEGKSIFVKRGTIKTNPEDMRRTDRIRPDEIRLYESKNHERNFIDCIYSGEAAVAPIEASHRTITVSHLANIAIRLGRSKVEWDPAKERFVGDETADKMLSREARAPWALESA